MFEKAIEDLFSSKEIVSDPIPFQPYISQIGLKNIKTADFISINDISQLRPELKEKTMSPGPGAGERLYKICFGSNDSWDDYFLREKNFFIMILVMKKLLFQKTFFFL